MNGDEESDPFPDEIKPVTLRHVKNSRGFSPEVSVNLVMYWANVSSYSQLGHMPCCSEIHILRVHLNKIISLKSPLDHRLSFE